MLISASYWITFICFFGISSSSSRALIGRIHGAVIDGFGYQVIRLEGLWIADSAFFLSPSHSFSSRQNSKLVIREATLTKGLMQTPGASGCEIGYSGCLDNDLNDEYRDCSVNYPPSRQFSSIEEVEHGCFSYFQARTEGR